MGRVLYGWSWFFVMKAFAMAASIAIFFLIYWVLPNGKVAGETQRLEEPPQTVTVRLRLNRDAAIVDMGGRRIWAGENQLSGDKARSVGVRFLQRGAVKGGAPVVHSLRVARAQAK